jgi:hypothetical protein
MNRIKAIKEMREMSKSADMGKSLANHSTIMKWLVIILSINSLALVLNNYLMFALLGWTPAGQ